MEKEGGREGDGLVKVVRKILIFFESRVFTKKKKKILFFLLLFSLLLSLLQYN